MAFKKIYSFKALSHNNKITSTIYLFLLLNSSNMSHVEINGQLLWDKQEQDGFTRARYSHFLLFLQTMGSVMGPLWFWGPAQLARLSSPVSPALLKNNICSKVTHLWSRDMHRWDGHSTAPHGGRMCDCCCIVRHFSIEYNLQAQLVAFSNQENSSDTNTTGFFLLVTSAANTKLNVFGGICCYLCQK